MIGAAGDLGGRVVAALRAPRRRRARAGAAAGRRRCVRGDLADPASLDAALAGITRLFLVSSPTRDQVVAREQRDRGGRARRSRTYRQDLQHPGPGVGVGPPRQPPGDRAAARGVVGRVDRAPALVLHDRHRQTARSPGTRQARHADRRGQDRVDRSRRHRRRRGRSARRATISSARCISPDRRRSTVTRSRSGSVCAGSIPRSTNGVMRPPPAASTPGSPTRPCTSTRPLRVAPSPK